MDVVKIDAEGSEPLVFRGMKQTIQRNPKLKVLMEFAPEHLRRSGINPERFLADLHSMGFTIKRVHDESGSLLSTSAAELTESFSTNLYLCRSNGSLVP